jgi:hypothetical protein
MSALVAKHSSLVVGSPIGSLDSYIDRVSQIPVLSKEEEFALATSRPPKHKENSFSICAG